MSEPKVLGEWPNKLADAMWRVDDQGRLSLQYFEEDISRMCPLEPLAFAHLVTALERGDVVLLSREEHNRLLVHSGLPLTAKKLFGDG